MTVNEIKALKGKRKITMLTAYDYSFGGLVDKAGIDIILVGDSLANVVLGMESTKEIGMDEMINHSKAVRRAVKNALLIGDMPFCSYQLNPADSIKNARRFIEEAGVDCVKLEWFEGCLKVTKDIVQSGVAVMGHIGLTPQTADKLGGFKVQGKDAQAAKRLIYQAQELEKAGCFAFVLECVPDRVAKLITGNISIPSIGIGAGPDCDGQVLVLHDMLGLFDRYTPKFVKKYADISQIVLKALEEYKAEIISGKFPAAAHTFSIKEEEFNKVRDNMQM